MPSYKRTDRLTVCSRHYTPVLHQSYNNRNWLYDVPPFHDPTNSERDCTGLEYERNWRSPNCLFR